MLRVTAARDSRLHFSSIPADWDRPVLNYGPVLYHMTSFNGGSLRHWVTHSSLPIRCSSYASPPDLPHVYLPVQTFSYSLSTISLSFRTVP